MGGEPRYQEIEPDEEFKGKVHLNVMLGCSSTPVQSNALWSFQCTHHISAFNTVGHTWPFVIYLLDYHSSPDIDREHFILHTGGESMYHQIELDEEPKSKSVFVCHAGLFEYNVMPFGLCNAPATFQHLMQLVIHGCVCHISCGLPLFI